MKWAPLTWIDARYEVSDEGLVRSWAKKRGGVRAAPLQRKTFPTKDGYRHVSLMCAGKLKSFLVHRLVLQAFTGAVGQTCNHENGIKNDNRLSNLRWCSMSENLKHSYAVLGRAPCDGGRGKPKKKVAARAGR